MNLLDDLKLLDRYSQPVQPAHQPDDPRLIGVHIEHGDVVRAAPASSTMISAEPSKLCSHSTSTRPRISIR